MGHWRYRTTMQEENVEKTEYDLRWFECIRCNYRCMSSAKVNCPLCNVHMNKVADGPDIKAHLPPKEQ